MSFAGLKSDAHDSVQNGLEGTEFERSRRKAINNWKRYEVAIKKITHPVVFKYCFLLSGHSELCLSGNAVKPASAIYNCSSSFWTRFSETKNDPTMEKLWWKLSNIFSWWIHHWTTWWKEFVLNLFLVDIAENRRAYNYTPCCL